MKQEIKIVYRVSFSPQDLSFFLGLLITNLPIEITHMMVY